MKNLPDFDTHLKSEDHQDRENKMFEEADWKSLKKKTNAKNIPKSAKRMHRGGPLTHRHEGVANTDLTLTNINLHIYASVLKWISDGEFEFNGIAAYLLPPDTTTIHSIYTVQ